MVATNLADGPQHHRARRSLRNAGDRAIDFALAAFAIVFTLPFATLIALLIVVDDPGPVLAQSRQIRPDGHSFMRLRFRTQRVEPDGLLQAYLARHGDEKVRYGLGAPLRHDPRRSKLGVALRRSGIEDLPLLINIVRGDLRISGHCTWRQIVDWLESADE
jgi:lipopolysaccharide/colanic/teichoic acid biosynthesis glycosyltransferase